MQLAAARRTASSEPPPASQGRHTRTYHNAIQTIRQTIRLNHIHMACIFTIYDLASLWRYYKTRQCVPVLTTASAGCVKRALDDNITYLQVEQV